MPDDTDEFAQFEEFGKDLGDPAGPMAEDIDEDPPSYHSGRVRIIGAEPAGDSVREVTGPVVDDHPELPHWNDVPTGQVPAVLDSSNGEEQPVAPPMWREEETDWEAQEEVFEPSMLSDDLPAVGALLGERSEDVDVERQPWHFESDDTLVIPPEPGYEPLPDPEPLHARDPEPLHARDPEPLHARAPDPVVVFEPDEADGDVYEAAGAATRNAVPVTAAASAAASRLTPPRPPEPRTRSPRTSRSNGSAARTGNVNTAGTGGRDMRVAIGTGVLLGAVALVCFAAGTVASMVIVCIVVLLATAEGYAAFRRAQYHPATLLGLVAVLSLMVETYNKGVAALPLVLVLLVAGSFIWYLGAGRARGRTGVGHLVDCFRLRLGGCFRLFRRAVAQPQPVSRPARDRLRPRRRDRDGRRRRGLAAGRRGDGAPPAGPFHQPQ